ncbi:regulator [Streptomyces spinoverrucosus]|uniref:helix-turn-helix domain-containing protein n=1 Tax=Streptomyces spinoverrucosus TaxID=284043 RepID=UPI0018C44A39|nr:helix-turn-helix domain-containing protein [Streptomyces spinoverrucosus]MBG0857108.1 regulator [Streptomyces spinoverrucosus]
MATTEHSAVRPALASLRRARELFLAGRELPDEVPQEIVAAWKRARFFGVRHDVADPAPDVPPHCVRAPESHLLATARPVLDRIAPTVSTGQASLVLTDGALRVLWSTGCARYGLRRLDLSEQVVGHNSAALALRTRRRAEVHGPEHFLDLWQDMSAVSVPIRAAGTSKVLGTVTVTSRPCVECGSHPAAPLAEAAAIAVEAELLSRSRVVERVLLDAYLRAAQERVRAVVAVDGLNRLVSEAAGQLLSPEGLEALERSAVALLRKSGHGALSEPASGKSGPDTAEASVVVPPVTSGSDGGAEAAADTATSTSYRIQLRDSTDCQVTLNPVFHLGSIVGAVAVLEEVGRCAATSALRTGVRLAGRSVPWRHAVGRATELSRSPEPLLLIGERGTGKTSLARELVANPLIMDAAQGEFRLPIDELAGGQPVLIRHAERLAQSGTATLNSLLDAHPGAPLLVTYTPGAPPGPCLQRLLDTLAARSVTLPALRERPDDIRELVQDLTPGPAPGRPPLSWSLDALRALEQYSWPGNVTELAQLVRAVAERRRAMGPVRRAELPDPVREGPAPRSLSPIEHAERSAILDALRLHGGNKARTAAALGIARATLYRKLRSYRS